MSTDIRRTKVNPRLFSLPKTQKTGAPRKNGPGQGNIRSQRPFSNSSEAKNLESKEFFEPEYLDFQKRSLKLDISNIEKELKPLKEHYEQLKQHEDPSSPPSPKSPKSPNQATEEFPQSPWNVDTTALAYRRDLSSMVKQSQIDLKEAQTQLAQIRRIYSEANRNRLLDEIKQYNDMIDQYCSALEPQKSRLMQLSKELDLLVSSDDASIIMEQKSRIVKMNKDLDDLLSIEDEFIKRNDEMLEQSPQVTHMSSKIERLKKRLASLQYRKSSKIVEIGKKRKMYDQKKKALHDLIDDTTIKKKRSEIQNKVIEEMKFNRASAKQAATNNEYSSDQYEETYSYEDE